MAGRVQDKIALVTGGGSGIGRASAETLAREGARVVVTDLNVAEAEATAEGIRANGGAARALEQDTTDETRWRAVIESIESEEGGLDIVLNNAGVSNYGKLLKETTLDHWRHVNAVNCEGVFLGTKYGIAAMEATGRGGSVINISSIYGRLGAVRAVAYNASKGAVTVFSKGAALECGQAGNGVRVNTIHPGFIMTGMTRERLADDATRQWNAEVAKQQGFGIEREKRDTVAFLQPGISQGRGLRRGRG